MPISEPPTPILRRAAVLTLAIASALALAATLECHAALTRTQPHIPLTPSLLYGAVLWLWWAPIAFTLWHFGTARPWLLRLSFRAVVAQVGCGVALSTIHLGVLTWTVHALARAWPQLWTAGYNTLVYFTMERFGFECAIYAILWGAVQPLRASAGHTCRACMRSLCVSSSPRRNYTPCRCSWSRTSFSTRSMP